MNAKGLKKLIQARKRTLARTQTANVTDYYSRMLDHQSAVIFGPGRQLAEALRRQRETDKCPDKV